MASSPSSTSATPGSAADSIEVDELHHPIHVVRRSLIPDTEGAGRYRGAPSACAEFGPIAGCDLTVIYTADGTLTPALGVRGGAAGATARAHKREADGTLTPLPACHGLTLKPGEYIVSRSTGGGGYGSPLERPADQVRHDAQEGWITRERARDAYGVVLLEAAGGLIVDEAATAALRRTAQTGGQGSPTP